MRNFPAESESWGRCLRGSDLWIDGNQRREPGNDAIN